MRLSHLLVALTAALTFAVTPGCSSKPSAGFEGGTDPDAAVDDDAGDPTFEEAGDEAAPPCDNLECQIVNCGNADGTTVTGTVYDPAAQRGLYNVFVYVPNRALDPIATGPVCTACQAPASGKPIASATTDSKGKFTIKNVPAGGNIPLVMQLGKWRRRINIPQVQQCQANVLSDKNLTRLPKKQGEGNADSNIPQIAFATGCDWAECFLNRTIGIDPSEFTGPSGKGRVHIYKGHDDGQQPVASPGDAYAFWGNYASMKKYDLIFNACECSPDDRTAGGQYPQAYTNMKQYIDGGGRFFGTHYHYNWFAQPTGPADYQMQAPWLTNVGFNSSGFMIDTSFPRGKAFADWAQANAVTTTYGQIDVTDTRNDVAGLNGGMQGNGTYKNSTQWIYHPSNQTLYFSFNAPTAKPVKDQCGRAVFSDVHLSGDTYPASGSFPGYCAGATGHDKDEQALEFLFFDLSSCVQDDKSNPIQPPPG
jgi:hypothetical protein